MDSLVVAYLVGWLAIGSYVVWLGVQQRSLARRIEEMKSSRDELETDWQQCVKAA
jgi:CcmD family protein